MKTILRLPAVAAMTGLSRSQIYALIKIKKFPAQIELSERAVGWLTSEVQTWLQMRVDGSRPSQRRAGK
jgi:prophage regulatory protein